MDDNNREISNIVAAVERVSALEEELIYTQQNFSRLTSRKSVRVALRLARMWGRLKQIATAGSERHQDDFEPRSTPNHCPPGQPTFDSPQRAWYGARFKRSAHPSGDIVLLTDSVGMHTLTGGVLTSLVIAGLLAERYGQKLRVKTLSSPQGSRALVLDALRLLLGRPFEQSLDVEEGQQGGWSTAVDDQTTFVSSSWWTADIVRQNFSRCKHVYVVQEDESLLFPSGDADVNFGECLADETIYKLINTSVLANALQSRLLGQNASVFEPAFPPSLYPQKFLVEKHSLFVYARPNHPRNLFRLTIESLVATLSNPSARKDLAEVNLVGCLPQDVDLQTFPSEVEVHFHGNVDFFSYADVIDRVTVGIALQHTPHPGYPSLELAQSGAMAITSSYRKKSTLDMYSNRIHVVEPNSEAVVQAIASALSMPVMKHLPGTTNLASNWSEALESSLDSVQNHFAQLQSSRHA